MANLEELLQNHVSYFYFSLYFVSSNEVVFFCKGREAFVNVSDGGRTCLASCTISAGVKANGSVVGTLVCVIFGSC